MEKSIKNQCEQVIKELIEVSKIGKGSIVIVGCSTSEVTGNKIGTNSDIDVAKEIFDGLYPTLKEKGIYLAIQCCEHLNRALIIEEEAAEKYGYEPVNVIPQLKAGGSFSVAAWKGMKSPVAVEKIAANGGIDIGDTLIGMHLKAVAVPVRTGIDKIGGAHVVYARVRPKFVGGQRACYDEELM